MQRINVTPLLLVLGNAPDSPRILKDRQLNRYKSLAARLPSLVKRIPAARQQAMGVLSQIHQFRPEAATEAERCMRIIINKAIDQTELAL